MTMTQEAISFGLKGSHAVYDLFLGDLTPEQYLHRPCSGGNCAAWITGHLVLAERRALGMLNATDLPPLPEGFDRRFGREQDAPMAREFGDVTILRPMFSDLRGRLIAASAELHEADLARPLPKPHPRFSTFLEMLQFMAIHVSMHAGQLSTIRRTLGKPAAF